MARLSKIIERLYQELQESNEYRRLRHAYFTLDVADAWHTDLAYDPEDERIWKKKPTRN